MCLKEVEAEESVQGLGFLNQFIISLIALPIIVMGVFWNQFIELAGYSKIFLN